MAVKLPSYAFSRSDLAWSFLFVCLRWDRSRAFIMLSDNLNLLGITQTDVLIIVTCLLEYENGDEALHSVRNHARDLRTVPADKLSQ